TLDPSVWIFDDRKILFEDAFQTKTSNDNETSSDIERAAMRWNRAVYPDHIKPPVNRSISRMEGKEILKNSYVIPLRDFIENADIKSGSANAILETTTGEVT